VFAPRHTWGNIMSIGLDTVLNRNDDILYASVGSEEAVMMSVTAGRYYGLNAVASRLWELLETPKTIAQLCAQICEEFEVDAQTCEAEVLKFVQDLIDNGVVHEAAA
jgi:Coenzyme PQQ synthesis protein D (PqqD)